MAEILEFVGHWLVVIILNIARWETVLAIALALASCDMYLLGIFRGLIETLYFILRLARLPLPLLVPLAVGSIVKALLPLTPEWRTTIAILFGTVSGAAVDILVVGPLGVYSWKLPTLRAFLYLAGGGLAGVIFGWWRMSCGEPEWEYVKVLPVIVWEHIKFLARTAPRAWYRYYVLEEEIGDNIWLWWLNDPLLDEMASPL